MYILYTDGKFEYASEEYELTYTPSQLSDNQSLAMYNGQISTVSVINGNAGSGLNMSNHYVLTIELSGIIIGPCTCTFKLNLQHDNYMEYIITKNMTFNGIQPFSLTIPIYNKLSDFYAIFNNNNEIITLPTISVNARATYIVS